MKSPTPTSRHTVNRMAVSMLPLSPRLSPMQQRVMRAAAVAALVVVAGCREHGPVAVLHGPGRTVEVSLEVAATPEERARGLMYRTSLAEGSGMLFVFDEDRNQSFWMKN